jgi:hypothetical protein
VIAIPDFSCPFSAFRFSSGISYVRSLRNP